MSDDDATAPLECPQDEEDIDINAFLHEIFSESDESDGSGEEDEGDKGDEDGKEHPHCYYEWLADLIIQTSQEGCD
eukprot:11502701-Ditylum_brightwellii.AAC.1